MNNLHYAIGALTILPLAANGAERPNILMICIDDLRQDGDHFASAEAITPNLDKFRDEGRMFTQQYVQVPTSGASRAMMLTGKYPKARKDMNNFVLSNALLGSIEGDKPETFIHHLRRNGYRTVGMGKVSHSDNGFFYPKSGKVQELPYSWDEFINNPNSPWEDSFDALLHGYSNGRIRTKKDNAPFEFLDLPDSCYADHQLADMAVAQLEKLAKEQKNGDGEPTFMAVGFYKPHLPFVAPKRYWDLYDDVDISISPTPDAPDGVGHPFVHGSFECFGQYSHKEIGGAKVRISDDYARELRRAYLSAASFTDAQVGRVLNKLHETGLDKNTIVIIWGDHGWHLGDQTIWGKHSTFERALNSVLMVKSPSMKRRGKSSDELISAIDIYPTICEYTGIEPYEEPDGRSFVDIVEKGTTKNHREYALSYWINSLSLRTQQYRLSVFNDGKKESVMLYDHNADPNEGHNIATEQPEVFEALMSQLRELNNGYLSNL